MAGEYSYLGVPPPSERTWDLRVEYSRILRNAGGNNMNVVKPLHLFSENAQTICDSLVSELAVKNNKIPAQCDCDCAFKNNKMVM